MNCHESLENLALDEAEYFNWSMPTLHKDYWGSRWRYRDKNIWRRVSCKRRTFWNFYCRKDDFQIFFPFSFYNSDLICSETGNEWSGLDVNWTTWTIKLLVMLGEYCLTERKKNSFMFRWTKQPCSFHIIQRLSLLRDTIVFNFPEVVV